MPDPVPGVGIFRIGLILHIVLPKCSAVCFGFTARQAEAGTDIIAAARRDARHTMHSRSAGHAEQYSLHLIRHGMGGGNEGFLLYSQLIEPAVTQSSRPFLAGLLRDLNPFLDRIIQKQFHTVLTAECRHKIGICNGVHAADAVIDMRGQHLNFQIPAPAQ